jgi:hypothetical protein
MPPRGIFTICIFFFSFTVSSLPSLERDDFWICPVTEINLYSLSGPAAFGGGLALSYGSVGFYGLRALCAADQNGFITLEITASVRLFLFAPHSGFFIQIEGGPAFFFDNGRSAWWLPVTGVTAGWRFLLGERWFIEPAVRAGYPYIGGGGLSAGFRF